MCAGTSSRAASPNSARDLAAAGRWQDALRAADSGAGAPDWLLAGAARALAAPLATIPGGDEGPNAQPSASPSGTQARLQPGGAPDGARGGRGADAGVGLGLGSDTAPRSGGGGVREVESAGVGGTEYGASGSAQRSGLGSRPRSSGSDASVSGPSAAAAAARRGRRLAWECCMRVRDKRLAAELVLECLGAAFVCGGPKVASGLSRLSLVLAGN